jgi:tetratricopeptide (TPR) repeat protein
MADAKTAFSELFTGSRDVVQGVEASLLRRRRLGGLGFAVGLIGAVLQVIIGVVDRGYFKNLAELGETLHSVVEGEADRAVIIGLIGLVLFGVGLAIYLLLRWTRVLQKESEEPFRYTVSLDPFTCIKDAAPKDFKLGNEERLALLHTDLRERLDKRIGRFSLLKGTPAAPPGTGASSTFAKGEASNGTARPLSSHIHITGEYVLRQDRYKNWFIHVMPTVQLGDARAPLTMAYAVRYYLRFEDRQKEESKPPELDSVSFEQLVERVYSSVATEVYRKIETDVRAKIEWFPTRHLRAVALFHEALDMARSNTVDAYDRALDLYRSAQRFFDLAFLRDWRRWLVKMPLIWRMNARYLQTRARVQIGHVRCQIYRQMTALQTGRKPNAIYECIWRMDEVIEDLRVVHARLIACAPKQPAAKSQIMGYFTFPRDRFVRAFMRRPLEPDYLRQRRILFDAYTVAALAHAVLGSPKRARERLKDAVAVDPSLRERDPVHLLAEAEISPDLRRRTKLLQQATDLSPSFQIAQYRLAQTVDLLFRDENQLNADRVANVIRQYDEVLRINPGNIAAIAGKGYLYWLTGMRNEAAQSFREGIEFKSIVRETSIAELTYGLARTLAEQGKYNDAFDQFMQSVAVDPDVAAWNIGPQSRTQTRYYDRINSAMVKRYSGYAKGVADTRRSTSALGDSEAGLTDSVRRSVRHFVANDLANAHLNDYFRNGNLDSLTQAEKALRKIEEVKPDNPVLYFNLAVAHEWRKNIGAALRSIDRAVKLAPEWQAARVAQINYTVSKEYLDALTGEIEQKQESLQSLQDLKALTNKIREKEEDLLKLAKSLEAGPLHSVTPRVPPGAESSQPLELSAKEDVLGLHIDSPLTTDGTTTDQPNRPEATQVATKIERLKTELSELQRAAEVIKHLETDLFKLRRQQIDWERNYNSNLRDALRDLTSNSRLWHLLDPGSRAAHPMAWVDNVLALRWKSSDGSNARIGNVAPSVTGIRRWRHLLGHRPSGLRWEQLDGSDVQALKSLAYATAQSALKEHATADWERRKELSRTTLQKCARFHLALAERFLEEDIDVCLSLTLIRDAQRKARSRKINGIFENTVTFWLEEDPWHFWAVKNWITWLGAEKLVALGLRLVYSVSDDVRGLHCLTLMFDQMLQEIEKPVGRLYDATGELRSRGLELAFDAAETLVKRDASKPHQLGPGLALLGRWPEAAQKFGSADAANAAFDAYLARLDPDLPNAYDELSTAWASLPDLSSRTARLRKLATEVLQRKDIAEKQRPKVQRLLKRLQIRECFGARGLTRQHVVTPIAIEVASNLVDLVAKGDSQLQPELEAEVLALRQRLRSTMGVFVPGLRFRGNEGDLPADSYIIMLGEIPLVMGNLNLAERFYPGRLDAPTTTRLDAREQADPLTSEKGWWLPEGAIQSLGLKSDLVVHPRTFMTRHVEAVLQHNLAEFLGHLELSWMIEELTLPPERKVRDTTERSDLVSALRSLLLERVSIAALAELRSLLLEGVPIAALADIVTAWPSLRAMHPHLRAQVEALRSLPSLRAQLPGNAGKHRLFEIGPKFESEIRNNLHDPDRVPVLGVRPELCQDMLAAVRQALPSDPRDTPAAFIVNDAPLRPHLRELVKLEWPSVPVLAVAELGAEAMASPRTHIELE